MAERPLQRRAVARATWWTSVAYGGRVLAQLASVVVLSRLLDPEDFGLMAMAVVVTGLATVVRDLGAGPAVVRAPSLTPTFLSSQLLVAFASGVGLTAILLILAPLVANLFGEPDVAVLLSVLSLGFTIGALGIVPQALLERRLAFRAIAVAEVAGGALGVVAATIAALNGLGATSLAIQALVQTSVAVMVVALAARWLPTAWPRVAEVRSGLRFGLPLAGFSTLNYLSRNADNALIGLVLGPVQLGFYSIAYRLMLVPVQIVTAVGNRVLLPSLARLGAVSKAAADGYLTAVAAMCLAGFPMVAVLCGGAPDVIAVLLGPGWEDAIPVLRLLSLVAFGQILGASVGPILVAAGRTDRLFAWGVVSSVITVGSFIAGLPLGIVGVAGAYAVASLGLLIPSLRVGLAPIGIPVAAVLRRVAPTLVAAAVGGIAVALTSAVLAGAPPLLALIADGVVMVVIYGAGLLLLDRDSASAAWRSMRSLA